MVDSCKRPRYSGSASGSDDASGVAVAIAASLCCDEVAAVTRVYRRVYKSEFTVT